MPRADRASQFLPFAALKGFEEALREREKKEIKKVAITDETFDDQEHEEREIFIMSKIINEVDVICEHKADGSVIPLKFRFMNEDGEYDTFSVKGYRASKRKSTYTTPDGIYATDSTTIFECMITVLGMKRVVKLYYDPRTNTTWRLAI
ncbi:hypothetical protein [Butyrivibrio sp.]|uniref:hypothetical protein n=1 Tax=Butyrivibrio sp. TaxID=28121 RepID=UPI0025C17085|nr:hypothetical protein [Butyrivibrio sp.]